MQLHDRLVALAPRVLAMLADAFVRQDVADFQVFSKASGCDRMGARPASRAIMVGTIYGSSTSSRTASFPDYSSTSPRESAWGTAHRHGVRSPDYAQSRRFYLNFTPAENDLVRIAGTPLPRSQHRERR
jgi:hypothetical protein